MRTSQGYLADATGVDPISGERPYEPGATKRRGRPNLPADQLRTGRLQRRVLPEIEVLAKQLSTEAIEEAIRAAARSTGIVSAPEAIGPDDDDGGRQQPRSACLAVRERATQGEQA